MSHTPHELTEQFPGQDDAIHHLKTTNQHFARMSDDYHALNREIHRGETNVTPMDDFHMADLRKRRLALLDQIKAMLNGG